MTEEMQKMTFSSEGVSNMKGSLNAGHNWVFRIRNEALAVLCSQILDRKVEATQDPLPSLKRGDYVVAVPSWLQRKEDDGKDVLVIQQDYAP